MDSLSMTDSIPTETTTQYLASRGKCIAGTDMSKCKGYLPRNDNPQPMSCVWLDKFNFVTCLRGEMSEHIHIAFKDMSELERQVFIDFQFKELERHLGDVFKIKEDLSVAKKVYGIVPRRIYVGKWIDVL